MEIRFVGGTGTVTGSKYLLTHQKGQILVDCGLFQGLKNLRLKNWEEPPFDPSAIQAVILTHAHIDHSGYIPLLVKKGFRGKIYCTSATFELCKILLPDAGYLQEEEAKYMNRHRLSKHDPALPLFDEEDAKESLGYFSPVEYHDWIDLFGEDFQFRFGKAGHILGASFVEVNVNKKRLVFSGDLGRPHDLVMNPPETPEACDVLVVESTYGDRLHQKEDPLEKVASIIRSTVKARGSVVVPAFAVGRTQQLLYILYRLKKEKRIPDIPIFLNSPMATSATEVFCQFVEEHRLSVEECRGLSHVAQIVRSPEESKALNEREGPMIIVSASGMATGGRVVHHLKRFLLEKESTILFTGFQAMGTRGAALVTGKDMIKIHGQYIPVRARVENINSLSAHADYQEIISWLKGFSRAPKMTFVTHGEPGASDALRLRIQDEMKWNCFVPEMGRQFLLEKLLHSK
ncbi:MAG: MBL fold metallo-hydrolase [Bdellovibrionaceae bacterium]|nr:MBL fold metallo-hydrolase [Pseudobdellovibrionaceae bacterium]|tara:strand:+ start:6108 stop:7487 length:1380 start_codon:yes stop_codon:yes gene_type:complete